MKKLFLALAFVSSLAFAEASFDQIEGLIQQQQYSAAAAGLEEIIKNHPKSAKAFYAMAQAQAGLGNQEKAKKALDIATGLNPTLDFAPASSVASLREAITPQVKKIEAIEESHFWRNFLLAGVLGALIIFFAIKYKEKIEEEEAERIRKAEEERRAESAAESKRQWQERVAQQEAERKAEEARAAAEPVTPAKKKTKAQLKAEADAQALRDAQLRAERAEMDARLARSNASSGPAYAQPAPTTVVQNSSNDMLTGVLIGNMISNMGHSHDTERTVIRETVREVPTPSRDSSWDDTPSRSSSRSSSWDDDSSSSSSSRSSSWDSDSSSSSSSSWSSSSSDSSSSSSSSWD